MNRIKFEIIRTVEKLPINLNHQHDYREYEVVIQINEDNAYEVFATDERASVYGATDIFESKAAASENAIDRARSMKKLHQ
jgi:uncharacterized protein YajQ (UPF0234 family)